MKIDKVEKVHSIGYGLKDTKTSLSEDVSINVGSIKIAGTRGEVINVPQWVGQVLADNKLAEIDAPDMIKELKQALLKEKMVGDYQMATLDPHFYIKLKSILKNLNKDDYDENESMMLELFRKRRGKIIKYADAIKLNSDLYKKLSVEEVVFYNSIRENSAEFEKQIRGKADE